MNNRFSSSGRTCREPTLCAHQGARPSSPSCEQLSCPLSPVKHHFRAHFLFNPVDSNTWCQYCPKAKAFVRIGLEIKHICGQITQKSSEACFQIQRQNSELELCVNAISYLLAGPPELLGCGWGGPWALSGTGVSHSGQTGCLAATCPSRSFFLAHARTCLSGINCGPSLL